MKTQELLSIRTGSYIGRGKNHEGQEFEGRLQLTSLLDGRGFELCFQAIGRDGLVYHEEVSIIASRSDGRAGLFNLNSNIPFLAEHILLKTEEREDR